MPPVVGTADERHALAVHLAMVGGLGADQVRAEAVAGDLGSHVFDAGCAMCHGEDGEWPMSKRAARSAAGFYDQIGRLPELNDLMPPFDGTDEERRALAGHLAALTAPNALPEETR